MRSFLTPIVAALALAGCASETPVAVPHLAVRATASQAQAASVQAAPVGATSVSTSTLKPTVAAYASVEAIKSAASEAPVPVAGAQPEVVPTQSQLDALAAASPDHLIPNAPPEPGATMTAQSFSFGSLFSWLPWPKPPAGDLGNFGKVNDTLWRGARPTDAGLAQLQAMGVKTIVNFENDANAVAHEQAWCQAHGVTFHSIALSVVTPPKQSNIDQFLQYANDPSDLPLYFHCMQGRDRTGTACFVYRISHDHWTFKQAYTEMKSYHFHTFLLGLQEYIREYAENHHAG